MNNLLISISPLALSLILISSRRASIANAGLIGAATALLLTWRNIDDANVLFILGRGLWIAWLAVSIILTGLIFQRLALKANPDAFKPSASASDQRKQSFTAIFLLGVFVESASGFGLGAVAAVSVLSAQGIASVRLAALALLSLSLVPWGALAIGTTIAAELTGTSLSMLGVESTFLSVPVLIAALALFWLWAPGPRSFIAMLREAGNVAALLGILWAANGAGFVDIAGILAAGTLFAFTGAYDRFKGRAPLDAGVFGAFALFIVAIRIIPGITELLRSLWIIEFTEDLPAFAPFAHPSFWLIVFGLGYAYWKSVPIFETIQISGRAFRAAYVPVAVTIGFVVLGQGISALGAQKEAVLLLGEISGSQSVYFGPIFAALAGWLTGSNAAAHGMLAEFQAALGAATGEDPIHTVAIQNVVASAYTMLSPMRIALVATALGLIGKEAEILRLLTPFAVVVLIIAWAATALT